MPTMPGREYISVIYPGPLPVKCVIVPRTRTDKPSSSGTRKPAFQIKFLIRPLLQWYMYFSCLHTFDIKFSLSNFNEETL